MISTASSRQIDRRLVERVVSEVLRERLSAHRLPQPSPLVANISVRHVHITAEHFEILFGAGAELTVQRPPYQEGQFSSGQTVDLVGPKRRMLNNVRILGPFRSATQIELAFSDAIHVGIDVPVKMSGDHEGTPGCIMMGPKGHLVLTQGVVRAQRHVHMSPADAAAYGVAHGDVLNLVIDHPSCPVTLGGIRARVSPEFRLEVHIDSDEGNARDLPGATGIRLEKPD